MIVWFTWAQVGLAVVAGLGCLGLGLAGRRPNDVVLIAAAVVEVLLLVQIVVALVAPAFGNLPSGNGLEFWVYLVSAALLPPAAVAWGLIERNRWSTVVIAVALLAVAVMVYRMGQIWFVQSA